MNIHELDSYDLGDAVKFNDRLNPAIWDDNERMRPEVREQLLRIADDFREFLGIDVEVKDITVSGSNAAYTYTPHSDIDLHLVVDLPRADENAVYRELFDAKKYAYNDMHDIRIGGYDVELYVQDANKTHHSQGIYSIQNDDWVSVPKRRKPDVDDISVRSKFEDLGHRIESAIATGDLDKITDMAEKLRDYRQAGLDAHGEFGAENLAFKILRTQGLIEKLYAARNQAKDELLSLDERKRKKKKRSVKYGYGAYWYPGTAYAGQDHPAGTEGGDGGGGDGGESLREGVPDTQQILQDFVKFAIQNLGIQQMPAIKLRRDPQWPVVNRTFGRYNDDAETLEVAWGQRHIMDVLRTVAHELTHKHQHERETVPDDAGETGSKFENEANAQAGILMRDYAALHPEYFTAGQAQDLEEGASGYIPTKAQAKDPRFSMALTVDIKPGQIGKEANKLKLKTDSQGRPQTARANGLFETLMAEYALVKEGIQAPVAKGKDAEQYYKFILGKAQMGRPLTRAEQDYVKMYQMYRQQKLAEVSDDRLQTYLNQAGQQVDRRQERMAQARERLNKGYEIYHAEDPTKIVHRFEANTPAEARRYYERYDADYDSDVDYDLQLRRATGLEENLNELALRSTLPVTQTMDHPGKQVYNMKTQSGEYQIVLNISNKDDNFDDDPDYDGPTGYILDMYFVGRNSDGNWSQWNTNVGEKQVAQIFSTIAQLAVKIIKAHPEIDEIGIKGADTQRSRIYSRLMQQNIDSLLPGWKLGGEGLVREQPQQAVAEVIKMPPVNMVFSNENLVDWAYNDAEKKQAQQLQSLKTDVPTRVYDMGDHVRAFVMDDQGPVLYLALEKYLDGFKTNAVQIHPRGQGKNLAFKVYQAVSDTFQRPLYSDQTHTDASRLGIWKKLIDKFPNRLVGYDQATREDLPLTATDQGPVVRGKEPIYVQKKKKDLAKPVTPQTRSRTRLLKFLPATAKQAVAEGVNDYLWHGSREEHDVLYPRQANDTGGKEESNKNAVYATPNAKVAIAMGLTTPGSDTGMFPNDPQMVLFKGNIRKGQMVYLHKVPKDLFIKHNSREWYSKPGVEEVKPIEVVKVPVDKYLNLIRTATPQDLQLRRKYMTEDEDLDEVKMSPGALEKFATSDAAKGIRAGFEAELIFRDTQGSSDDIDPEPNYDADERAYSIAQVVEFFENDEYGYGLTDRERNRLEERLDEAYMQWRDEQITSDFRNDAEDLIRDVLLEETPMSERINVYLTDSMQRSDEEADRIIAAGVDAPKFNTSKDQAAYAAENPDYAAYLEAADAAETELDESVEYSVKEQDGYWDEALDDYRDDWSGDDDSFFSDIGLRWMSDVANEFGLDWPVWDLDNQRNQGSRSWEDIGNELAQVIDMPVVVSDNYHSTRRRPGQWILEPDGSLHPDDQSEEAGLEIVSPPMPLLTAIEKLKQVTDWANDPQGGNAYTNATTGLHMGVSLPTMKSEDATDDTGIDYVKLILFMGDKYVLDQFGRTANTYTASALDKFRQNIKGKKSDPAGVVELLRHGLTELAYRELQKGVGTSKYTSAHIQNGYIEFRSPGGDWLAKSDEEIGILENTMLRFARAMAIAGDPSAERQEYAKKLYKLVTQENPQYADALKLFSEYSAGTINTEQLKKQWADAVLQKEIPSTGQEEYEVYDMANKNSPFGIIDIFYATDYDSAYNQYIKKYSQDPRQLDVRLKQPWFDVMDSYGDIILSVRASDFDRAKEKVQAEYGDRLSDDYEIYRRPDDTPEPEKKLSPRAQVAKRITTKPKTATQYNYDIVDQRTVELRVVDQFRAETPAEAERVYSAWLKSKDLPDDTANYGYRKTAQAADDQRDSVDIQRTLGIRDVDTDVAQNFAPDYSAYERNSDRIDAIRAQAQQPRQNYELVSDEDPDRVIQRMNNATADEVRAYIAQQEAGGMPPGFLRTRIVAESIDPVSGAGAVPPRQDPKSISKKSVTPAEKVSKNPVKGQPYRSAIGQAISQKDLENLTQQIQVARKLGDSVMEMEDTPPEVLRALDQAAQKNGYRNWADVKANPRSNSAVMTVAKLANTIMKTTPPHHAEKLFYKNKTDENFVADVDEGWKQALAGAALAGGIAMAPGTARATDVAQSPNVNKPATTQSAGINFQETLKDLASFGVMFIPGIGPVIKAVNLIRSGAEIASAVSDYKKASHQFDAALARQQAQRSVDLTTATEEEKEEFLRNNKLVELDDIPSQPLPAWTQQVGENFADGKVKGKSRPGRVKRAGASCDGSVTDLRRRAKNASGEKAKMYHWCANMKSGRKK